MEDGGAERGNWDGLSPEVLDMIFQYLPVSDLLSCSRMSKNWKKAARDVLKRSRECYAYIKCFYKDIQDLNEMIDSTDIMEMINGLHIRNEKASIENLIFIWLPPCSRCSDVVKIRKEPNQKLHSVLCGQWRYLDMDMGKWAFSVRSLLREVVLETSDSLQKLVLGKNDWMRFIPCCEKPFPKLKVIQVQQERFLACCSDSTFTMSKFAPNLEKITGAMTSLDVRVPVDRFVLERMKSVKVVENLAVPNAKQREIFGCVSGLYRLDLQQRESRENDEENLMSWYLFVFPFVLRSLNTLKELRMYTLGLYNLSLASDGLIFPNLQRLSLATHQSASINNEILALKKLNLPKLCPNLEQVELGWGDLNHEVVIPVGEPDEVDQSDTPVAIDFECRDGIYNHEYLELFSKIYPKLSKLKILKLSNVVDYEMSNIFWELKSLEYLEIRVPCNLAAIEIGIEALLCGINIEEAKLPLLEYQKKIDKLNSCIVPIRPSLLNTISLKELKISEEPGSFSTALSRSWVIQVTENLPERYVRNMTVTFDGSKAMYNKLNRMRAFTILRANAIRAIRI